MNMKRIIQHGLISLPTVSPVHPTLAVHCQHRTLPEWRRLTKSITRMWTRRASSSRCSCSSDSATAPTPYTSVSLQLSSVLLGSKFVELPCVARYKVRWNAPGCLRLKGYLTGFLKPTLRLYKSACNKVF